MIVELAYPDLTHFFEERLTPLRCLPATRAYITCLFGHAPSCDFGDRPFTLVWQEARDAADFAELQTLADSLLWLRTFKPERLRNADIGLYDAIGSSAYGRCHAILGRKWPLYEELADRFANLSEASRLLCVTQLPLK